MQDERGATAVMVAIFAVVLFMAGAVAVDMGQAYAKRSALQSNVDMAVMAAAAELTKASGCNTEVVTKAEEFLVKAANEVHGQVTMDLDDGDPIDGEISCPGNWRVNLIAPRAIVELTMGKAFESGDSLEVPAHASAQIKSPSQTNTLPMYAVSGCDSGSQVLTDPPPGPAPVSAAPATTPVGDADLQQALVVTPNDVDSDVPTPYPVVLTGDVKDVKGWTAQAVFYNADGTSYTAAGTATVPDTTGGGYKAFSISVPTVPAEVLAANGVWWVRVQFTSPTGVVHWTRYQDSAPFTVGDLLFCDGMVSGNFGTLRLARNDVPNGAWVEMNIIRGVMPHLTINASILVPCSPVDSDHAPVSPTDCVSTDPGFPNEAATDGFVNGSGSTPGRLDADTTPGCDRNGGSDRTPESPNLNDDLLSCYIVGGHSVGDVVAGENNILSADIFDSPRFFFIPVIPVEAANGASGAYPIIAFRPGFITNESMAATATARGAISGHNGLTFHSGHIEQINVVLFPESALPGTAPPIGGEIDYTGSGTKVLALVE
ncbi:TadE/TadG family type IV pilus assembly protein [Nocardioides astragali]|nr:pilus assembly protein TadG-related protein [Nocardioides astragali]